MMNTVIDLIIPCMGRLDQLKQSLPQAVKQVSTQCFLVDYSCPDNCSDWAQQQGFPVTSIKVKEQQLFNLSKARNAGALAGTSPWLLFVDADILLADDFTQQIITQLSANYSYHASPRKIDMMGTFLCQRQDFIKLGGYDEIIQGWGAEDADLYSRLAFNGIKKAYFSSSLLTNIPHSDSLRTENYTEKDLSQNHISNRLYLTSNRHLASLTGK